MPVLPIIRMGHPVLRQVAKEVAIADIQSQQVQSIIRDMKDTMHAANGLGIAAPQVGISLQICIVEVPEFSPRYGKLIPFPQSVIINPVITPLTQETEGFWEGCLSIPGIRGFVKRPRKIRVSYYTDLGEKKDILVEGFASVTFQHQADHLNGQLFIDKISDNKVSFIPQFQEFKLGEKDNVLDD